MSEKIQVPAEVDLTRQKTQMDNIFTYHSPKEGQQERYVKLREKAKELAYLICEVCPNSREKSLAITDLQRAVQMANASIAINE